MSTFSTVHAQAWLLLVVAGLLEIGWAVGMKATEGFTGRDRPSRSCWRRCCLSTCSRSQ